MRAGVRYGSIVSAASLILSIFAVPVMAGQRADSQGRDRPDNGFARTAPWNTKLPANVPIATNSAAIVHNIQLDKQHNFGTWAINTDTYSTPIFYAGRHTPTRRWTYSDCLNMPQLGPVIAGSLASVPTPAGLIASQGTDESTTIYQPSTDTYWDFWRAEKDARGHWSACWGGRIKHYSANPGIFTNPLGATATGLPLGAFTIRISELQRGYIDHAINLVTVRTRADCFSWPATRNDGNTAGGNIPCEGQRFRLDPSFDISTLYSPAARIIARAMQQYGLVLTDKGGAVVTYAQDPRPYMAAHGGTDPYQKLMDPDNRLPPGTAKYVILGQIPIDRLQALPLNYGQAERAGEDIRLRPWGTARRRH